MSHMTQEILKIKAVRLNFRVFLECLIAIVCAISKKPISTSS